MDPAAVPELLDPSVWFYGVGLATTGRAEEADGTPEWNGNIAVFRLGTEPPHTTLTPYADVRQALAADRTRIVAGPDYAAGWLHRALFGPHYRSSWTAPNSLTQ